MGKKFKQNEDTPECELDRDADFSELEKETPLDTSDVVQPDIKADSEPVAAADDAKVDTKTVKLEAELAEFKDKYLRALAEVENTRKRALKEKSEILKYQGERILVDILEIADNFERALKEAEKDPESLKVGVPLIYKLLMDSLSKWEVKAESGLGKPFDPAKFRALSRVPVDDALPGTIVTEMRKTYMFKDRLLRAGEVVVAAEKATVESEDGGSKS